MLRESAHVHAAGLAPRTLPTHGLYIVASNSVAL